ncbi:hypothetical protein Efla_001607 [Eimeria flavescens]
MARTSTGLFQRLTPPQAVSLAINVARLAAVEIASSACLPPLIQAPRVEAARACTDMIAAVLSCEGTRQYAKQTGMEETLLELHILVRRVSEMPPESQPMQPQDQLLLTMNIWRNSHFPLRAAVELLFSGDRGRSKKGRKMVNPAEAQMVSHVIEGLSEVRMRQLLANERHQPPSAHPARSQQGPSQQHPSQRPLPVPTVHHTDKQMRHPPSTMQITEPREHHRPMMQYPACPQTVRTTTPRNHASIYCQTLRPQAQPNPVFWSFGLPPGWHHAVVPSMRQTSGEEGSLQQRPSQPPSPAPTVHLSEIYNQPDPRGHRSAHTLQTPEAPRMDQQYTLQRPSSFHTAASTSSSGGPTLYAASPLLFVTPSVLQGLYTTGRSLRKHSLHLELWVLAFPGSHHSCIPPMWQSRDESGGPPGHEAYPALRNELQGNPMLLRDIVVFHISLSNSVLGVHLRKRRTTKKADVFVCVLDAPYIECPLYD